MLTQQFSSAASFLVSSAIALIALLITIFFLPETLQTKAGKGHNIFDLGLGSLINGFAISKVGILPAIVLTNRFNPITYSYPLYLAGVLTFCVLLFAIATRKQYTPRSSSPLLSRN